MTYHNTKLEIPRTIPLPEIGDIHQVMERTSIHIYHSISEVPVLWDNIVPEGRSFLRSSYLTALETTAPEGMQFCYITFTVDKHPIGVAACQIKYFKGNETFGEQVEAEKDPCYFKAVSRYFKGLVTRQVEFYTLVCGNLLLTGEHGYFFDERIPQQSVIQLVENGLEKAKKDLQKRKTPISLTLLKDFKSSTRENIASKLVDHKYLEFTVQPAMVLDIRPEWNSFEDYLAAMSSKYRVRVKRAYKKGKDFVRRELNFEEIEANEVRIFELYQGVSKNATFNTFILHPSYFTALKRNLNDKFRLFAYYHEEKLVGFYTTILNGDELEAHFLGFEYEYNRSAQIYLNMLYDMVKLGLEERVHQVFYARTALEIKSSVGAVPHEMYCYMRHRNSFPNKFLKNFFDYLNPEEEWTQRRPFKEQNTQQS